MRRHSFRSVYFVCCLSLSMVWPCARAVRAEPAAPAALESQAYREAIETAVAAYQAGELERAHAAFMTAHQLAPNARTLRGLGIVELEQRRYHEAQQHLAQALASLVLPLDAALREATERSLAEAQASQVVVGTSPQAPAQATAPSAAALGAHVGAARASSTHASDPRLGPWLTMGAGAASLTTGFVLLALGARDRHAVEDARVGTDYSSVRAADERAPRLLASGYTLLGVGAAALGAGLWWWRAESAEEPHVQLSLSLSGVQLRGRL